MEYVVIVSVCVATISVISNLYKDITIQKLNKQHQEERKDLLNRLMAKDINEYKSVNNPNLPKGANPIRKKLEEFDRQGLYEE